MNDFMTLSLTKKQSASSGRRVPNRMRSAENVDITGYEKMDYDCIFFFRNANSPFSPNEYP
ncbi:hypothetical protein CFI04_06975 [Bacillus amyloliquefaciens]|nr:hypothetical protein CFI04_06975 [Bacillus amyloliquefaciens]